MSYLVLARKYRPQTFEDVVEQAHVTQTLKNAIQSERVAHAMLFSGPRGTGKTTIARILAKAMNCENGPTPTPCNQCRSCTEITGGNAVDVFEIDGASNNGVDNIRDLRDNVKYMPAHSRYKIYIIDEVHMLSTAAFNALLKTLEEPPAHILFFFATTEPHKIPITILSRCQQHDLRRVDLPAIAAHLGRLCQQEEVEIPAESLDLIAREAGGSVRDALSLLDQLMVCSEGAITHEQTTEILGVVDRKRLFELSAAVLSGDVVRILKIIEELYEHGYALKEFYTVMLEHFRNLLMVKMGRQAQELVDAPAHELHQMAEQVQNVSPVYLSQILDAFYKEENTIRFTPQPRLALEMAFIRLFQIRPALPIDAVIQKLDDLSKGIVEAAPGMLNPPKPVAAASEVREKGPELTPPRPVEKTAPVQTSKDAAHPPHQQIEKKPPISPQEVKEAPPEQVAAEAEKTSGPSADAPPNRQAQPVPEPSSPAKQTASPATASDQNAPEKENAFSQSAETSPDTETPAASSVSSLPDPAETPVSPPEKKVENEAPPVSQPEAALPPEDVATDPMPQEAVAPPPNLHYEPGESIESAWGKLTTLIGKKSPALSSALSRCRLASLSENSLIIESQGSAFDVKRINKRKNILQAVCNTFFNREMDVTIRLAAGAGQKQVRSNQVQEAKHEAANHPLVSDAIEIFNGTLIDVKIF